MHALAFPRVLLFPLFATGFASLPGSSFGQPAGGATPTAEAALAITNPAVDVAGLLTKARELGTARSWSALKNVGREIVAADPDSLEGNAWLGIGAGNVGNCREAIQPLTKAFNGHAAVVGVGKMLAKCLGSRTRDKMLAGRAWFAAARDDKDGDEALKAASFFAGNQKAAQQLYDSFAYADERGRLPDNKLVEYAAAAEAAKKVTEAKSLYERALEKAPEDRVLLLALARLRLKTKDARGAEVLSDRLLKMNPNDQDAVVVRADTAAALDDSIFEERVLRQALARQEQSSLLKRRLALALGRQARARMDAGDPRAARDKAEEALKLDVENVPANETLARALWADGDRVKAAHLLRGLADRPEADLSGEGLRIAAEVAMDAKELKKAKALVDRAGRAGTDRLGISLARLAYLNRDFTAAEKKIAARLAASPGDGEALKLGGDIAYESGRIRTARERFEKADASGALPAAGQARLCEVRVRDGAYEGARSACGKALRGGLDDASVHANLGLALARLGDKEGARKEIGIAVSKGASDKSTQLVRGLLAESDGLDGDALEFYQKVLAADPGNVEANAQSGRILLKRAKYDEAAIRLGKAFRANPQDPALAVSLAKAQLGTGHLSDAQKTIRTIPEGAIDEATRLGLDGQVQRALGNYRKANELFEKALRKDPGNADLLALQGENYLSLPHYEKAIQLLEAAQKADPSRLDVSERLARLYAELGDADKAAQQLARIDSNERTQYARERKAIDSKDLRRVSVNKDFETIGRIDDPMLGRLGRVLRDAVAADMGLSPYIQVIDHSDETQTVVREARDLQVPSAAAPTGARTPEHYARYALSGNFQMVGDSLQMSCAITDINTRQSYRGSADGSKERWAEIEKRAVLEMLSTFVPLSAQERMNLERAALERSHRGNLESVVRMKDANDAIRQGDQRLALHYLEEAHAADLGNARAIVELAEVKKRVALMNRVAILEARKIGDVEDALVLGLRYTLSSKLSGVNGIQVIDNDLVDSVLKTERDYIVENRENIDPKTLPQIAATQIAANILLQPFMEGHGEGITVGAMLIQLSDGRVLLGDQVSGTRSTLLELQNELALDIVRKLYGEPSEQEMAILRKKQSLEQYQHDMAELARLRAEKLAAIQAQPSTPAPAVPPIASVQSQPTTAMNENLAAPPRIDSERYGRNMRTGGLVCAGAGLVSMTAGLVYYVQARSLSNRVSNATTYNTSDYQAGRDAETSQKLFYSLGAAMTVTGAVLYILGAHSTAGLPNVALSPMAAPGAAGLSAQGAF
jgi:tetratricopeptide (TPR) repeat protein